MNIRPLWLGCLDNKRRSLWGFWFDLISILFIKPIKTLWGYMCPSSLNHNQFNHFYTKNQMDNYHWLNFWRTLQCINAQYIFFHFQFVTDVVYASSYLFTFNIFLTSTLGNLFSFSLEEHSSGVNLLRGYMLQLVRQAVKTKNKIKKSCRCNMAIKLITSWKA